MHAKIVQLATTGQLPAYDELPANSARPAGAVAHPRAGPQEDQGGHDTLKIHNLPICGCGRRVGPDCTIEGLRRRKRRPTSSTASRLSKKRASGYCKANALCLVVPILEAVRAFPQVIRAEVCGSLRRRAETIGDLDILFSSQNPPAASMRL